MIIVTSSPLYFIGYQMGILDPILLQILTNITNILALSYAVYVYSVYDVARNKAVDKLAEKGVEVHTLEEGVSAMLARVNEFADWMDENKPTVKRFSEKFKNVDLDKVTENIEDIGEIIDNFRKRGFSKEKIDKFFVTLSKIDPDKLNEFIDEWIERQKIVQPYKEIMFNSPKEVGNKATHKVHPKKDSLPNKGANSFFPLREKKKKGLIGITKPK